MLWPWVITQVHWTEKKETKPTVLEIYPFKFGPEYEIFTQEMCWYFQRLQNKLIHKVQNLPQRPGRTGS